MPFTLSAFNHDQWERHGLADYSDIADQISECNVGEDAFSGFGEWFFVPDEPLPNNDRVIYFGSWGNDNSPGASMYTNAEIFDGDDPADLAEFAERVKHWESQSESVEDDDCDVADDSDEPNDDLLAQQELEDFEQADEYFGDFGDGDSRPDCASRSTSQVGVFATIGKIDRPHWPSLLGCCASIRKWRRILWPQF